MVQTVKPQGPSTSEFTVLRPIFVGGERKEVGATVTLTRTQGTELAAAGKVGPYVPAPKTAKKAAQAADAPAQEAHQ